MYMKCCIYIELLHESNSFMTCFAYEIMRLPTGSLFYIGQVAPMTFIS